NSRYLILLCRWQQLYPRLLIVLVRYPGNGPKVRKLPDKLYGKQHERRNDDSGLTDRSVLEAKTCRLKRGIIADQRRKCSRKRTNKNSYWRLRLERRVHKGIQKDRKHR